MSRANAVAHAFVQRGVHDAQTAAHEQQEDLVGRHAAHASQQRRIAAEGDAGARNGGLVVRAGHHRIELAGAAGEDRGSGGVHRAAAGCGADLAGAQGVVGQLAGGSQVERGQQVLQPGGCCGALQRAGGPKTVILRRGSEPTSASALSTISGPMPFGSPSVSAMRRGAVMFVAMVLFTAATPAACR